MTDGYIKFNIHLKKEKKFDKKDIKELNKYRQKLKEMNLIGIKENNVGFGNISQKFKNGFIITASKTGGIKKLSIKDYSYVYDYDLNKNELFCKGYKNASSESLSHAAVYESNNKINSVIHIHSIDLWKKYYNKLPTTSIDAKYGTVEMAKQIKEKIKKESGVIIMGGHEEGIITYSPSIKTSFEKIKNLF